MAKYFTEQVGNGVPYTDILEVHNRMIGAGKAIAFFYHFIKDYSIQIAQKHSLTLDFGTLPDSVTFPHDYISEGDVVDYLNDLVFVVNDSKDLMYVVMTKYTDFFKYWLDTKDSDSDNLSSFITGDTDYHNVINIDYAHYTKTWSYSETIQAEDFNELRTNVYQTLMAMRRVFGALYSLIQAEGLDTKSAEFTNYGASVSESSAVWDTNNIISDWTYIEPYPIESGATEFYSYMDGYEWNTKVIVWQSSDETAHRFTIWDYFKQEYVFDSGWYPKQEYPTFTPPQGYTLVNQVFVTNHILISSDLTKIGYVTCGYAITYDGYRFHTRFISNVNSIDLTNLDELTNTYSDSINYNTDDDDLGFIHTSQISSSRYAIGTLFGSTSTGNEGDFTGGAHFAFFDKVVVVEEHDGDYDLEERSVSLINDDGISELGTQSSAFYVLVHVSDSDGDDYHTYSIFTVKYNSPTSVSYVQKTLHRVADDYDTYTGSYVYASRYNNAVKYFAGREDRDYRDLGIMNTQGYTDVYTTLSTLGPTTYKLSYGMPLNYVSGGSGTYLIRLDSLPNLVKKTDGTVTGFDRSTEFVKIDWKYPDIKWLVPLLEGYNVQTARTSTYDSIDTSAGFMLVSEKYFVPQNWYCELGFDTDDLVAQNEGSLPILLKYWGTDTETDSTYDYLLLSFA